MTVQTITVEGPQGPPGPPGVAGQPGLDANTNFLESVGGITTKLNEIIDILDTKQRNLEIVHAFPVNSTEDILLQDMASRITEKTNLTVTSKAFAFSPQLAVEYSDEIKSGNSDILGMCLFGNYLSLFDSSVAKTARLLGGLPGNGG